MVERPALIAGKGISDNNNKSGGNMSTAVLLKLLRCLIKLLYWHAVYISIKQQAAWYGCRPTSCEHACTRDILISLIELRCDR